MSEKIEKKNWIYLAPISNLLFNNQKFKELLINRITFIDSKKLRRNRKKFGIKQRIIDIPKRFKLASLNFCEELFNIYPTIAIFRDYGIQEDVENKFEVLLSEEIDIFSLAQLGFSSRIYNAMPMVATEKPCGKVHYLGINENNDMRLLNARKGKIGNLIIDDAMVEHCEEGFFLDLLLILYNDHKVSSTWKNILYRAASMAGKSQYTQDIVQVFILNHIVLESLLLNQGEKFELEVTKRLFAMFGMHNKFTYEFFKNDIIKLYKKRNKLIHEGDSSLIDVSDIKIQDELILNIFLFLCNNTKYIKSKSDILKYTNEFYACDLLKIKHRIHNKLIFRYKTIRDLSYKKL